MIQQNLLTSLVILLFTCVSFAEVTDPTVGGPEEGETYYGENAPNTCTVRVTGSYRIRRGPSTRYGQCGMLKPTSNPNEGTVQVVGMQGNWLQITSPATRNCPNGVAYAYRYAFDQEDFARFDNGECGIAAMDTRRNPQPVPAASNEVKATNNRGHNFPLDRCLGIKNDGGLGHYGAPRRRGSRRYPHTGTDYYAPQGTPARAPCDGTVTSSSYGNVAGNTVILRCNNGDVFKFMHLHSSPKKAATGSRLSQGAVLGGVGNTGNARGQAPHLHVEAYIGGRRIDPQSLWSCSGDSGH